MIEEPLNVKALCRIVWRRRLLVGLIGVLGFLGGIAYAMARPPLPSAAALVLLPPSPVGTSGTPTRGIHTQVLIAGSSPVLAAAGRSVSPAIGPTALKRHVAVESLSNDVLQFTVSASTPRDAAHLANAVADSYIHYVTGVTSRSITLLKKESTRLQHEVQDSQDQISALSGKIAAEPPSSPSGRRDSAELASLQSEQQQLTLQLNSVNGQLVDTQLASGTEAASTRVLQRAASTPASSRRLRAIGLGAIGLAIGLLIGAIIALAGSRRDDLLRLRSELAGALGVPVIASLGSNSCQTAGEWSELLERPGLSPATAWNLRSILHRLPSDDAGTTTRIRVISFVDDAPASTLGALLAAYSASIGVPTVYLPPRDDAFLSLREAWTERGASRRHELLALSGSDAGGLDADLAHIAVSTVLVDRSNPELADFSGTNVLSVSAGEATRGDLARLALTLTDTGAFLEGIVVVNPLPHDSTAGVASNGVSHLLSSPRAIRPAAAGSTTGE